ncbi:MAG: hypothetical protein ACPGO7_03435, partial [Alphaproteobacteria bacterium]
MSRITRSLRSANSSTRADGRLQQEELPTLRRDYNFLRSDILDDDIDFTRNSGATQTNSSGLVAYAPNNVLKSSEDIINDWILRGSISITAGHSDPDGGTTAYLVDGLIGAGLGDFYMNVRGLQ